MTALSEPAHLTKSELAARWRVTPRTIERKMRLGTAPPHMRQGTRALFPIEGVKAQERARTFSSLAAELAATGTTLGANEKNELRNVEPDQRS